MVIFLASLQMTVEKMSGTQLKAKREQLKENETNSTQRQRRELNSKRTIRYEKRSEMN